MQMKLETNLPVIFLTLLVISIVVLGYLELKKLWQRIKQLEFLNKEKKTENKSQKVEKVEGMNNVVNDIVSHEGQTTNEVVPENTSRIEEWQINNEKENIINTLNRKEEYIEEIDNDEEQPVTSFHEGGAVYVQPPNMYKTMINENEFTDDIIEKIRNDEEINFENTNEEEMFNKLNENSEDEIDSDGEGDGEGEGEGEGDGDGEIINQDEDLSNSEKNSESDEEINLKEINEEDDFSKSKITVDESYSVNDLKAICKNLGLQLSGNKSTLIKRIMEYQ